MPYSPEQLKTIRAIKGLSETPAGQTFLDFLQKYCYAKSRTFVVGDPYLSAYNEGVRSVYLEVMRLKELDERILMQNHNQNPNDLEDIAI